MAPGVGDPREASEGEWFGGSIRRGRRASGGQKDAVLTLLAERHAWSMADGVSAAWMALEKSEGWSGRARAALWLWDLATGRVEWEGQLSALFGYTDAVTNAAWREKHIHPADRERIKVSLQRATIVNDGTVWVDHYRFRQADGSYATVTERAFVVHDDAGPRVVLGAITPSGSVRQAPPISRSRSRASGPDARERPHE